MPRTAAFTSVVLRELLRQLEYAPDETHRRQMDAAEQLLDDIEPERLYPDDFIVYRITSYRIDRPDASTSVVGDALTRDLVNFIQQLSWDLSLDPEQPRGRAVGMDELARRLGVSRRTLQRCRKAGLVMHWVRREGGRRVLSCFPDALDRFLERHGERLVRASRMTRLSIEEQEALVRGAGELVACEPGASLNEIAARLAAESGRGHETIRRLLRRNEERATKPLFSEHGPLRDRDIEMSIRARRRGVPARRIADHFGKSPDALHRAVLRHRRRRLAAIPIAWSSPGGGDELLLQEDAVRFGLPHPSCPGTSGAGEGTAIEPGLDLRALNLLHARAAQGLEVMSPSPTVVELDEVETDLRWATMLHLRLVLLAWGPVGRIIEERLQQPLEALPREARLLYRDLSLGVINDQIERSDPNEADELMPRIERRLVSVLDRRSIVPTPGRASVRSRDAGDDLALLYSSCIPWPHLVPGTQRLASLEAMNGSDADLVRRRYGLDGSAPSRLSSLAEAGGTTITAIERRLGPFTW